MQSWYGREKKEAKEERDVKENERTRTTYGFGVNGVDGKDCAAQERRGGATVQAAPAHPHEQDGDGCVQCDVHQMIPARIQSAHPVIQPDGRQQTNASAVINRI